MDATGSRDRANVRQQRLAWTDSGDSVRVATHDSATQRSAQDIISGLETRATAAPRIGAASLEAYGAARKALAEVASGPKPGVALRELIDFGKAVYDGLAELQGAADKASGETQGAAAAADAATTGAAVTTPR